MGDSSNTKEGAEAKFTPEVRGEYRADYPWKKVKKCA